MVAVYVGIGALLAVVVSVYLGSLLSSPSEDVHKLRKDVDQLTLQVQIYGDDLTNIKETLTMITDEFLNRSESVGRQSGVVDTSEREKWIAETGLKLKLIGSELRQIKDTSEGTIGNLEEAKSTLATHAKRISEIKDSFGEHIKKIKDDIQTIRTHIDGDVTPELSRARTEIKSMKQLVDHMKNEIETQQKAFAEETEANVDRRMREMMQKNNALIADMKANIQTVANVVGDMTAADIDQQNLLDRIAVNTFNKRGVLFAIVIIVIVQMMELLFLYSLWNRH